MDIEMDSIDIEMIKKKETTETVKSIQNYQVGKLVHQLFSMNNEPLILTDTDAFYLVLGFIIETYYPDSYPTLVGISVGISVN